MAGVYATGSKEQKTLELLTALYEEAYRHKMSLVEARWAKVDKYFQGKNSRFGDSGPGHDEWRADTNTNLCYSFYLSMVATLMRELPGIAIRGRWPVHDEIGKIVAKITTAYLRRNEFPERQEEMLFSGSLYGRALLKLTWDASMDRGIGGLRLNSVSAKNFCWQPGKKRYRDAAYTFEYNGWSKLDFLTAYPHRRADIDKIFTKPDSVGGSTDTIHQATSQGSYADGTGLTDYFSAYLGGSNTLKQMNVVECWMDDPETIERYGWVVEAKGSKLTAVKRKRHFAVYPTGRYFRFVPGCLILEDRPSGMPAGVYSEYINMSDDSEWPMGELDQLIPIQDIHNTRNNQTMDSLNYSITGDRLAIDARSGIKDKNELTNAPGEILEVASVEGIKPIPGPRTPPEAFTSLEKIEHDFDRISGAPDILSQLQDIDIRSGYGVDQISDIVRGRLKLKTYSMQGTYESMFKQATTMVGFFLVRGTHYPFDIDLTGVHPEMFDYDVKAGMNLPSSRRAAEQLYLQYFDRGIADEQYLAENADLPNIDQLIERQRPLWEAKKQQIINPPQPARGPAQVRQVA